MKLFELLRLVSTSSYEPSYVYAFTDDESFYDEETDWDDEDEEYYDDESFDDEETDWE